MKFSQMRIDTSSLKRVDSLIRRTCDDMNQYVQRLPSVKLVFFEPCLLSADMRIDDTRRMRVKDLKMKIHFCSHEVKFYDFVDYSGLLHTSFSQFQDYARLLYVMGVYLYLTWKDGLFSYSYTYHIS